MIRLFNFARGQDERDDRERELRTDLTDPTVKGTSKNCERLNRIITSISPVFSRRNTVWPGQWPMYNNL